jgi:hypothetical protein
VSTTQHISGVNTIHTPHTRPRSSSVLPENEAFHRKIQRKTRRRRHRTAAHSPKTAHTLRNQPQHTFAPAPTERCCGTSQHQQKVSADTHMIAGN